MVFWFVDEPAPARWPVRFYEVIGVFSENVLRVVATFFGFSSKKYQMFGGGLVLNRLRESIATAGASAVFP
jgi:hypothetical protein